MSRRIKLGSSLICGVPLTWSAAKNTFGQDNVAITTTVNSVTLLAYTVYVATRRLHVQVFLA